MTNHTPTLRTAYATCVCLLLLLLFAALLASRAEAQQPTKEELHRFGALLADAFNEQDADAVSDMLNLRELGRRAGRGIMRSERELEQFADGFAQAGPDKIVTRLLETLQSNEGSVRMMRVATRGKQFRPMLRWDLGDNGFDYLEFVVERASDGALHAVDWHQLSTGELFSVSIGAVSRLMIDPNPGMLRSLLGVNKVDDTVLKQFVRLGELERSRKYVEALAALNALPTEIKESRILMIKGVTLASQSQREDLYRQQLAQLAQHFADDPSAAFMLLDHFYYEGDLEKALASLAAIESRVDRDGMTETLRANLYYSKGRYADMLKYAEAAVRIEPEYEDAYFTNALASALNGRFEEAVALYKTLADDFGYEFSRDNFTDEALKAFVASPAFATWLPAQ